MTTMIRMMVMRDTSSMVGMTIPFIQGLIRVWSSVGYVARAIDSCDREGYLGYRGELLR